MSDSSILIRPARLRDLNAVIRLHRNAFAGSMGVRLGRVYQTAFLSWFIKHPQAECLVASKDGDSQIVGYVFGSEYEALASMNKTVGPAAVIGMAMNWKILLEAPFQNELKRRIRSFSVREALFSKINSEPKTTISAKEEDHIFSLVGIGVDSTQRRQGIAARLIAGFEQEARKRDRSTVRLSVYKTNDVARAAYARAGFQEQIHPDSDATLFYVKKLDGSS